ncbi:O-methyltransferase [bacterium]|nr:O-methyltransferase [bacterium]
MEKFDKTTEEILKSLEKTQHDFWNISRVTGEFLYTLITAQKCKNVIEVGTSNGYSGIWIGKALKQTGGHLTTIEFYDKRQSIAKENFKLCKIDDIITPLQGDACTILEYMPEDIEIDFAFIDANKRQYIDYFHFIDKHIKKGGIIAADNVLSHEEKVKTFIDEINQDKRYENVILNLPAGLSLARKISD